MVDFFCVQCYNTYKRDFRLIQSGFDEALMHTAALKTHSLVRWFALRRRPERALPQAAAFVPVPPDATGHVEMPLSLMRPGDQGHVLSLCECCPARQHLLELGFTPGTPIEFVRRAPLGDPLTVRIRGYLLSLRRHEADAVRVRRCPPDWDDAPQGE